MLNDHSPAPAPHSEDIDYQISLDCGCYCELHTGEPCDCECIDHLRPSPTAPKFVAGWNNPGYLPETDPCYFDTAVEACRYLVDTIDRWWDDDYDTTDDDTEREAIDARWIGAHSQLPYLTPPFSIIANGISFFVEPITKGN